MTEQEIELKEKYSDRTEMVLFVNRIPVNILLFRRHTHDFTKGWEPEYLNELVDTLSEGMVVFDVGAEEGEFSAMVGNIVGGENVHLFEPSPDYWPNIIKLWQINNLQSSNGYFDGYVGSRTDFDINKHSFGWPDSSNGKLFYGTHQCVPHTDHAKTISLDDYCRVKNVYPNVIMCDIEGAELDMLCGCKEVIEKTSPTFFISIHSDQLILERSNGSRQDIHDLLSSFGYSSKHINTDHEEHWKFYK